MNLHYTLPDREQELLAGPLHGQKLRYCVPYDLDKEGNLCGDGWIAVTGERLYILKDGAIADSIDLAAADAILCVPQIDSGLLLVKQGEKERLLCRFTMRHMVRCSYVARGTDVLCRGDGREVVSREKEKHCLRCGRVLPGTSLCPRCDGRGRSFHRFFDLCRPYMAPLLCITLFMLVISAITIGQQYIQRYFVDDILVPAQGTLGAVLGFFGIMLGFMLLTLTLTVVRNLWSNSLGTRISRDLRARVFHKINSLSLSFMDSRQAGELMNRVVEDSAKVRQFMEEVFADMFTQSFTILGAMIVMLLMDWKLALLAIAFMPAAVLLVRAFHRKEKRLWRQQWRFNDKVNNRLQDVISGIRVVKSFGQEQRETQRFQEYTERLMQLQRRNERFWATLYPFVTFLLTVGTFFVIYFGGASVLGGRMTPGQLTQFAPHADAADQFPGTHL